MPLNYTGLTQFWPIFPFYAPRKTPENLWFLAAFMWYKMGTLARNGLNNTVCGVQLSFIKVQ